MDMPPPAYVPAVGPRLRQLLVVVFAAVAVLGATGVYLLSVRLLEMSTGHTYTNQATLWAFLVHAVLGVVATLPFLAFAIPHLITSQNRNNRAAVRRGIVLLVLSLGTVLSGLALLQLTGLPQLPTGSASRGTAYVLHLVTPVLAVGFYVLHRLAGPMVQWRWGAAWGGAVAAGVVGMGALHLQDPRKWFAVGPAEGAVYFEPSRARTADGNFIPARTLMMDAYCQKCHPDTFNDWFHSAHHFSSFNNPPYRFSVRETREVGLKRDGHTRASRWCAGCHDPVPFFSGAFDDPKFDDVNHPTSQAGITCTVCHAMTHVNSTAGNGDYTIEEPPHYPFAASEQPVLQWLNNQLVRAKPDFHKKTFLKPFHRTAEFCSTCHKVSLPVELNHYKEFLRGQNHYDTFLLSGVSGHNARAFYYPPRAKENCAACHMPLKPSADFGARDFAGTGTRSVHDHLFPGANTGLPALLARDPLHADRAEGFRAAADRHAEFLRDKQLRIDLFGLREGGSVDGRLLAPLRPRLPALEPGATYLVEVVIRTLGVGHHFTQGTVDSNEVWVEFTATSGGRELGASGRLAGPGGRGPLDEWAHRVNVLALDRHGNRINRRNPQDIFTPLYDHQVPPGAAQVVHYELQVPADAPGPVELTARLRYRKFDFEYMALVHGGDDRVPELPVVTVCEDAVTLPVAGRPGAVAEQKSAVTPAWQRWNDYGIGCLLEGGAGAKRGELRQAEDAFRQLLASGGPDAEPHARVNLARVYIDEGRLDEAARELTAAREAKPPPPWWTLAWFNALVSLENARDAADFDTAIADLERIVDPAAQPRDRGFDFTRDYVVLTRLGSALFKRSQFEPDAAGRDGFLRRATDRLEQALAQDGEDLEAHFYLGQCYARLAGAAPPAPAGTPRSPEELLPRAADAATLAELAAAVAALGREPVTVERPRRPRLDALLPPLREAFRKADTAEMRSASAAALAAVHRELHAVYRPDDLARSRTARLYRQAHPAADRAAEAVVIYPTRPPASPRAAR
jgi:tetratricopeptide (TPR) repeat protein